MFKNPKFFNDYKKYNTKAIGIDLGTTYSSVAIYQNQKVHIIPNDQGKKITSSYVAFTQNQRLIGDTAFSQTSKNPFNTIFQFKRLLGRKFSDPIVQEDIKRWPFKVQADFQDKPVFVVKFKKQIKKFYPQQIQSMILSKLKSIAQKYVGESIQNAVITVPANFTDGQRQATKDAGKIAGINVIRILSQPVAAAIAYGLGKQSKQVQNVLIFDFGGGTLDVSILTIDHGVFEVKSTSGDTHLGGIDFDNKIVQYCIQSFYNKKGIDIRNNPRAIRRLKNQCQKAKRILSSSLQVTIQVDSLDESEDFSLNLSRTKFEELCKQQFFKIMEPVYKVIKDSGLNVNQINEVVLVGGSSRIPKIRQILKNYLGGKEPNMSVNLDQAVVYGAAIHAAILSNQYKGNTWCRIIDTAPFSIGIQTQGGIMSPIVVRNTSVPTEKSLTVTTSYDNQSAISIIIFQGEDKLVKNNKKLGHFNINNIQPGPKGVHPIQISLQINEDGIMTLGISKQNFFKKLKIQNKKGRLSNEQINKSILESERLKKQDQNMLEVTELKNQLESYCFSMKQKISQIQNWMRQNKCTNAAQYMQKFNEINQLGKSSKKRKI